MAVGQGIPSKRYSAEMPMAIFADWFFRFHDVRSKTIRNQPIIRMDDFFKRVRANYALGVVRVAVPDSNLYELTDCIGTRTDRIELNGLTVSLVCTIRACISTYENRKILPSNTHSFKR